MQGRSFIELCYHLPICCQLHCTEIQYQLESSPCTQEFVSFHLQRGA
jgi:hypothetical protein